MMDQNFDDFLKFYNQLKKTDRQMQPDYSEIALCKAFYLKQDITKKKFGWLERDYKKGEIVYEYHGQTYGCISSKGKAFSEKPNAIPFFELPLNCVGEFPNQN